MMRPVPSAVMAAIESVVAARGLVPAVVVAPPTLPAMVAAVPAVPTFGVVGDDTGAVKHLGGIEG
jgi:hypothetical protein